MTTNDDPTGGPLPESGGEPSAGPAGLVPASALRRLIAFLIDLVLIVSVQLAIGGGPWGFVGIFALYHTVSLAVLGRTVGKAVMALRVQRADGTRLRWLPAFLRSTVGYLASAFLLLGFLHVFRDPRRRTWHDVLFESEVVQEPGPLSVKQLVRTIDEWTEQVDVWLKRVLARYNRLRGLWQFLLTLTGLVTLLRTAVERVGRWLMSHTQAGAAAAETPAASGTTAAGAATTSALGTATSAVTALVFAGATLLGYEMGAPASLRPWDVGLSTSTALSGECSGTITPSVTRGYIGDVLDLVITIKPPFDQVITRVTTNNPGCTACDATRKGPGRFTWRSRFGEPAGKARVEFIAYDKDGKVRCRGHSTELTILRKA